MKNFTRKYVACEIEMSKSDYSKIERGEIDLIISKKNRKTAEFKVSIAGFIPGYFLFFKNPIKSLLALMLIVVSTF